jgi:hypothetical protein
LNPLIFTKVVENFKVDASDQGMNGALDNGNDIHFKNQNIKDFEMIFCNMHIANYFMQF